MFKRLFWLAMGAAVGFSGSLWAQRRLRQKIEQLFPDRVARQVSSSVRALGADVLAAAKEGKEAMQAREQTLRARLQPPAR